MTIIVNGKPRDLAQGITGADLLGDLGIPPSTTVSEVNGHIVHRDQFASLELKDGDVIELVAVVGGG